MTYIETVKDEFTRRGQGFHLHGSLFLLLIKPDLIDLANITFDLSFFEWLDIENFVMQHIEFKTYQLWTTKFVELRKILEENCSNKVAAIFNCWTSLLGSFICLKKVVFALLSAFGSIYTCEQVFTLKSCFEFTQKSVNNCTF